MRPAIWGGVCLGLLWGTGAQAGDRPDLSRNFDIANWVPCTTSRVVGTPEPPPPYQAQRAFPKLAFKHPLYVASEPGRGRMLVVEQSGRVLAFRNDPAAEQTELFCEIPDHDTYGLTFHPQFARNRFVYIFSNGPNSEKRKRNRILRYEVRSEAPFLCDPQSQQLIIEWDSNGHNGGDLAFGPDGFLYISAGDGTSDSDGDLTGQDLRDLVSGMLRIDVDRPAPGKGYSIPADNPFLKLEGARPELWAYGFRNPWRISFDPQNGNLWVGDIGQDLWELILLVQRGGNYGWSIYEGSHPFYLERKPGPHPVLKPIVEHPHSEARSITGGLVYQGQRFADLRGMYIYGDYSTGKIWGFRYVDGKVADQRELADTSAQILGFGRDQSGELSFVDYGTGHLFELVPTPAAPPSDFPRKLSETGLFLSTAEYRPQPGLIPYSVNSPLWSDGAAKDRWIALPGDAQIEFTEEGAWKFPEKTVLVKTFALDAQSGETTRPQRIETRLLTFQQGEWQGYSYRWDETQTDATLVPAAGVDRPLMVADRQAPGGSRPQTWHYPSRAECMVCHSRAAGFVLGLNTLQMNKPHDYGAATENQLQTLERLGRFPMKLPKASDQYPRLPNPTDEAASVEARARSYLHANCAHCHVAAGGGNAAIDLHFKKTLAEMKLRDTAPQHDRFGIGDAQLIAPGDPARSILYHRLTTTGRGRMPPLSSSVVDPQAAKLLAEWIKQLD